ncbi:MAG: HXXEE domain-containing protein [Mycobacterium leprae]
MLAYLDERLSLKQVITLFLLVFVVHDAEEILTVQGWVGRNEALLAELSARNPAAARMVGAAATTTGQFSVAVVLIFIVLLLAVWLAHRSLRPGPALLPFAGGLMLMFLHVFTHAGSSLLLRTYTPGVITAVILALPYSLYAIRRLLRAELVTWRFLAAGAGLAVLLIFPILLTGFWLGRTLLP